MPRLRPTRRRLLIALLVLPLLWLTCDELVYRAALSKSPGRPALPDDRLPEHLESRLRAVYRWPAAQRISSGVALCLPGALVQQKRPAGCGTTLPLHVARQFLRGNGAPLGPRDDKLAGAGLAEWLRRHASESQLLRLWSLQANVGRGRLGLEAGALAYFDRPLELLLDHQLAALVALERSPSWLLRHPERWFVRRTWVLHRWREEGLISEEAHAEADSHPLEALPVAPREYALPLHER